ncbi:MAG TPA: 2Fe-2S iron-sulfur cluster-binding protein [Azospirillaceae bacterium]|nr:2Fe-2S iron-sulfur cluster-binding protein [Azospirillaceae bacterium]
MSVEFILDGKPVTALPGETTWQAARRLGTDIPHLCHKPAPGYRPDGNCRACMVEVKGECTLVASRIRTPKPGMEVVTASERARTARRMVIELLASDMPARAAAPDPQAPFWRWAEADRDASPGNLFIPFCYREAAANLLTDPALDPHGKIPEFKLCAARVTAA